MLRSAVALLAAALALAPPVARAQTLTGRTLDHGTGAPVGGATVVVFRLAVIPAPPAHPQDFGRDTTALVGTAKSDADGRYGVALSGPGPYRVIVMTAGNLVGNYEDFFVAGGKVVERDLFYERGPFVAYTMGDLERHVEPLSTNRAPQYPPRLREAGTSGEAVVQFVVDSTGVVRGESVRILRATHPDFGRAVENVARGWRFKPAMLAGHPVAEIVQVPLTFSVGF